ncbi:MAG TPA: aspartate dehydrogenase [Nitrososphaera sp.]|jgi:aspartate dehydrogenase
MPKKNIGILGCGSIGSNLALSVDSGSVTNATIRAVFDIVENNAKNLKSKMKGKIEVHSEFQSFLDSSIDLVVEAASQDAIKKYGLPIIESKKELMIMSAGALAETDFLSKLLDVTASMKGSTMIYIPTGAIAGIDAIRSIRHHVESITLTTTKSPKALADAPFFQINKIKLDDLTGSALIYEGPAAEAVKMFPANVNVAAVLSLAGIGVEKTKVKIVVNPYTSTNQHEILARGDFGELRIIVNNVPIPGNPKTSFLALLSALECLRTICEDNMRIGS